MRLLTSAIALALFAIACGGGSSSGDESARFCEIMEEFVSLADEAIAGAADGATDLGDLEVRVEELVTEAEAVAPPEIADIINSPEDADQQEITTYVSEECGVELPQF